MATKLKHLHLAELSLCGLGVNKGAKVTLFKSAAHLPVMKAAYALAETASTPGSKSFADLLAENETQRRRWEANEELWPLFNALTESLQSIAADVTKDTAAKRDAMRVSVEQFMNAVTEKVPDVEQELEKALRQNPATAGFFNAGKGNPPGDHVQKGETNMDDKQKVADLEKTVADLTKNVTKAEADAAELKKRAETAEARAAELTKAVDVAKADEVIKVGDTEVRKSAVGDATFAVIKAQQAEIAKERDARELAELSKSAETEYGSLPGGTVAKAKVLRSIAKMGDEDRRVLESMLKAGNAAMNGKMTEIGKAGQGNLDGAEAKLDKMAEVHAKEHKITKAAAYDEVLKTEEGRKLYSESLKKAA